LTVKEFLEPFASIHCKINFHTPDNQAVEIRKFECQFITPFELETLQSNNSIEEYLSKCLLKGSPPLQQILNLNLAKGKQTSPIGKTPWFNYYMEFIYKGLNFFFFFFLIILFIACLMHNYSSLAHPVGLVAVASTTDENIFDTLKNVNRLDHVFESFIMRLVVLDFASS
jgi:hypothetical protein